MTKIYIKYHNDKITKIERNPNGCWVDLRSSKKYLIPRYGSQLINLGVSMKLPKYFQANIVPRSSTFKNFGLIQLNHMGIIDDTYCGDNDIWMFNGFALVDESFVDVNDRICQFEIRPSQFAPFWVKLKWLISSKIEFIEVNNLNHTNRGGFGTSGKQ